ncbi:MAG: hypothetical protein WA902_07710 [Thermosynechococcaceae cyanobacterium]
MKIEEMRGKTNECLSNFFHSENSEIRTNDYDLSPTRAMAKELEKANKPYKRVIFPTFGKTHADGHSFCARGEQIWGNGVFSFLDSVGLKEASE